jgi:hypothetical protein
MIKHTQHLVSTNVELEQRVRKTHAGQASWAVDPAHTCRECLHWGIAGERYLRALQSRPCAKYVAMTNGKAGKPVPYDAHACRFFEFDASASDPPPTVSANP